MKNLFLSFLLISSFICRGQEEKYSLDYETLLAVKLVKPTLNSIINLADMPNREYNNQLEKIYKSHTIEDDWNIFYTNQDLLPMFSQVIKKRNQTLLFEFARIKEPDSYSNYFDDLIEELKYFFVKYDEKAGNIYLVELAEYAHYSIHIKRTTGIDLCYVERIN